MEAYRATEKKWLGKNINVIVNFVSKGKLINIVRTGHQWISLDYEGNIERMYLLDTAHGIRKACVKTPQTQQIRK